MSRIAGKMVNFKYLYDGLCGLANAHRAGTMAGHLGAAVVAGYFWGEDLQLAPEVVQGVEGELQRIMQGEEAIWFDAAKVGLTPQSLFGAMPAETADATLIPGIARALTNNGGALIESGHNTIFASIAIRALHDHSEYATPSLVSGIVRLIDAFTNAYPGRGYYGKQRGWIDGDKVELPADANAVPRYRHLQDLVDLTIAELIASAPIHRQGFGGLWHVVNHAAAIIELDRLGEKDLAIRALEAHHRHLRLWRSLPDVADELGPQTKSAHDPLDPAYWHDPLKRDQAQLTHRIKTLYGFYTLLRHVANEPTRQAAKDALLYLMA